MPKSSSESGSEYRLTAWCRKEQLTFAVDQLEKHHIPYEWRCRDGRWAIFRRCGEEDERIVLAKTKRVRRAWTELFRSEFDFVLPYRTEQVK